MSTNQSCPLWRPADSDADGKSFTSMEVRRDAEQLFGSRKGRKRRRAWTGRPNVSISLLKYRSLRSSSSQRLTYETKRRWKGVCEARERNLVSRLVWRCPSRRAPPLDLFWIQIGELEAAERAELTNALMRRVLPSARAGSAALRGEGTGAEFDAPGS